MTIPVSKATKRAIAKGVFLSEQRERITNLECALKLIREWGCHSKGYDAFTSHDLAAWIDAGMIGEPPKPRH